MTTSFFYIGGAFGDPGYELVLHTAPNVRSRILLGEWAELGEDMLSFEVLACTACRRVELRLPSSQA